MAPRKKYVQFRSSPSEWGGAFEPDVSYSFTVNGVEDLVISEGHPYQRLGKTNEDLGGHFYVSKHSYSEAGMQPRGYSDLEGDPQGHWYRYNGGHWPYLADVSINDWPSPPASTVNELQALGTTAIARCIPTNPLAGLTVALGELRSEGIPTLAGATLLKDRAHIARNAGSEYLNHQFGWVPLLNDIRSMARSVKRSKELEADYIAGAGKRLKRRFSFPTVTTESESVVGEGFTGLPRPVHNLYFYNGTVNPKIIRQRRTSVKRWFSGCFTYYLPPNEGLARSAAIADKLYGTRITPETLWNLTPWTWAADWVTNFGDVVHNVSRFTQDGLVMPYAYMMEESSVTDTYLSTGTRYTTYPGEEYAGTQSLTTVVKQRVKATPFGFGLDFGTFTQRQWSILAALGISQGGRKAGH